jgi:hypothetical protein
MIETGIIIIGAAAGAALLNGLAMLLSDDDLPTAALVIHFLCTLASIVGFVVLGLGIAEKL